MTRELQEHVINNYWFYLSTIRDEHPLEDARIVASLILNCAEVELNYIAKQIILSFVLS